MSDALKVSSDIFFYQLGARADAQGPRRSSAGRAARLRPQDRDRPAGRGGRAWCPTASGATRRYAKYETCVEKDQPADRRRTAALYKCGGIERTWTTGDNVNLAVGQGDLQATPLQVAVAYSALANGGTIVTPHLGQAIEDGNGVTMQELPQQAAPQDQDRPARPRGRARRPAPRRQRGAAARRPTSSRAGRSSTRSTARPARPSASRTPIRRGTRASSRTATGRSWSS